jgi:PAS domain S-box-containing protein
VPEAIPRDSAGDELALWRPLAFLDTLREVTRVRSAQCVLLIWMVLTAACIVLGVYQVKFDWNALPVSLGPIHFTLTIYPPLVICLWMLFWMGFEWAFLSAYLATFVLSLYSGMQADVALLFALVDPLALAVYALAYRIAPVSFDLRSLKSIGWFLFVSFVAAVGGSVGSFVWSSVHRLTPAQGLAIWQGWWAGALFQAAFLNAPILAVFGRRVERLKSRFFQVRHLPQPTLRWITFAIATGGTVIVGFLLTTSELADTRMSEALGANVSDAMRNAVIAATNSWKLTVWTGMILTLAGSLAGIFLAYAWNRSLLREVTMRTTELQESEQRFRVTFDQAAVGIAHVAPDGRWLRVNRKLCEIVEYTPAELMALTFQDITHPDDLDADLAYVGKMLAGEIQTYSMQKRYIRKSGSLIWINLTVSLARGPDGQPKYFISIVEDITGRKQLEEQLHQSQKMEAIGQLAGGVAHDFNNLLTIIGGYGHMLLAELEESDSHRGQVEEICAASDRAAALTRQLLAFSRRQPVQQQIVNLNDLVWNMKSMLHRLLGETIKLDVALNAVPGKVRADPGQIEQVIVNLAVNSKDAMPSGGNLTLEVTNVDVDSVPQVMLAVRDTGAGMNSEVQSRLFEPFFTTKSKGQGTGLGLSIVYGIVKQSGGNLIVRSELGYGTDFQIYFPRVFDAEPEQEAERTPAAVQLGSETILLVEDEEAVRRLAAVILRSSGYTVLEARNGEEALGAYGKSASMIALLVTDMIMPGINGRDLAEMLRASRPQIGVLYISGYTDKAFDGDSTFGPGTAFLQKPFAPEALARKVRDLLDQVG